MYRHHELGNHKLNQQSRTGSLSYWTLVASHSLSSLSLSLSLSEFSPPFSLSHCSNSNWLGCGKKSERELKFFVGDSVYIVRGSRKRTRKKFESFHLNGNFNSQWKSFSVRCSNLTENKESKKEKRWKWKEEERGKGREKKREKRERGQNTQQFLDEKK